MELSRPEGKGLGFNIIGGEGDAGIFISYISPGSISGQSEKLTPGDLILEVLYCICVYNIVYIYTRTYICKCVQRCVKPLWLGPISQLWMLYAFNEFACPSWHYRNVSLTM